MVSKRLKQLRKAKQLSQKDLGAKLGMTPAVVSSYEKGVCKPGFDVMHRLHKKFKINLNWLIAGKGEMFM